MMSSLVNSQGVYGSVDMGPAGGSFPDGAVTGARAGDGVVALSFDDTTVDVPVDWLRDNCACVECRITQTDERRIRPWRLPPAQVTGLTVVDGVVVVDWAEGHTSRFEPGSWAAATRATRRGAYTATLWRAGYELTRVDHDAAVHDLDARRHLFEAFRRDGAVVVTGAPAVPGAVLDFMRNVRVTLVDSSLGFLFDVKLDPAGYNVAFTAEELPLHNDNAQYAQPPSGQVLSMVVNEATGGDSMAADGWSILEQLRADDPDAVETLSSVAVGFRQYSDHADGFTRAPLVVRDASDRFVHLRFSNQLMQPLPFDHPRLAEWYRAYRALGALIADPSNHVTFRLRGGEMLMVNGYRVLHARKAFTPDGPRHLQDVYFNTDDVFGHLARMTGDAVNAMSAPS